MFKIYSRTSHLNDNLNSVETVEAWLCSRRVPHFLIGKTSASHSISHAGIIAFLVLALTNTVLLSGCGAVVTQSSSGQNNALANFTVSPDSIDFGTINLGKSGDSKLYLINQSVDPVSVSQLTLSNAAFKVDGFGKLPLTAPANSTTTLNVHFVPNTDGDAYGSLTVISDLQAPDSIALQPRAYAAGTSNSSTVKLHGKGKSAAGATPAVSSLTCSSGAYTGSGSDTCAVTLSAAAPTGGLTVNLTSNDAAVAVPASVTVPANVTSAGFTATIAAVNSAQVDTITASAGSSSSTFAIQLNAAVPTLNLSTSTMTFGNVTLNSPSTQSLTLSSGGTSAVTVSGAAVSGSGFSISGVTFPITLNPGHNTTLTVEFDPATAGSATGQLSIASNSSTGSMALVSLSGTGLTSTPAISALSCTQTSVTGAGTDACTVTLSAAAPSGGTTVALSSSNSAVTVPASVIVAANTTSAVFTASASAVGAAQSVTLTATIGGSSKTFLLQLNAAVPTLTVNATSVPFGTVMLNSPTTQSLGLTSSGTAPVTVNSASVTGTGFSISGLTLPVMLNPGQTASLNVEFDPAAAGSFTGQLTIASTSSTNPTARIALSGTGQATSYVVNLSWTAPTSSSDPVAGYRIYRAVSGSPAYLLVNSSVDTQTVFTDSGVQSGSTYEYYVTSVDNSGVESTPSNIATLQVP